MSARYGLYAHTRKNRTKSVLLLGATCIPVCLLLLLITLPAVADLDLQQGQIVGYLAITFVVGCAFTAIWVTVGYHLQKKNIERATGATEVSRAQEPTLYNLTEALSISRGLPVPRLQVIETDVLNAYATGFTGSQYRVTVTRGLLKNLDKRELEAVLAHELTHILNGDVRLMTIAGSIAGIPSLLHTTARKLLDYEKKRPLRKGEKQKPDTLALIAGVLLLSILDGFAQAIRSALSRSREFLADAGSVEITKDTDALIQALRKVSTNHQLDGATSELREMCFYYEASSPDDTLSHPPLELRIKMLVETAGGVDKPATPPEEAAPRSTEDTPRPVEHESRPTPAHPTFKGMQLCFDGKVALKTNISIMVGRQLLKAVHSDARYLSDQQFRLELSKDGSWTISPAGQTTNDTLVDGQKLERSKTLKHGMRISVGNAAKGVERLSLEVRLS